MGIFKRIKRLERDLRIVEKQLKIATCYHDHTEFTEEFISDPIHTSGMGINTYYAQYERKETCLQCGKVLRRFYSEEEYLKARLNKVRIK